MKTVLLFLLASLPVLVVAQPSHWRYSLSIGQAKPFTHLTTAKPILAERFRIASSGGVRVQAALERSVTKNVSLRASLGLMPLGYNTSSNFTVRDSTSRPLFSWGSSTGNAVSTVLTTGTLGVTLNSRNYGRAIFTAGLDGVVRFNGEPDEGGRRWGSGGTGYMVVQGDTQRFESRSQLLLQSVVPVTVGLAARLGMDYRLSKRGLFSVEVSYTKGFGYVRNAASDDLLIDGVPNTGRFTSRASNVAVQIGYKHSLFRINPLDPLQFTPYNQFNAKAPRLLSDEQRLTTFSAKSMLYEVRGGYGPLFGRSLNGRRRVSIGSNLVDVGGTWGYFVANRQMIGLSVDYQWFNHRTSPTADRFVQIGPVFRTYATRQRLSPYLEGGYQVGWFSSYFSGSRFIGSAPFTMGMSVRVSQLTRLNLNYVTRFYLDNRRVRSSPFLPQISLSYIPKVKSTSNAQ